MYGDVSPENQVVYSILSISYLTSSPTTLLYRSFLSFMSEIFNIKGREEHRLHRIVRGKMVKTRKCFNTSRNVVSVLLLEAAAFLKRSPLNKFKRFLSKNCEAELS